MTDGREAQALEALSGVPQHMDAPLRVLRLAVEERDRLRKLVTDGDSAISWCLTRHSNDEQDAGMLRAWVMQARDEQRGWSADSTTESTDG